MNLSEEDKKRIQEEEEYRTQLRAKFQEEAKYRQEIIHKKSDIKSSTKKLNLKAIFWSCLAILLFAFFISILLVSSTNNNPSSLQADYQPTVNYTTGYASGYFATVAVPEGTTRDELINLLNYFHNLNQSGVLSQTMNGHTIFSIFDDDKWVIEENYNRIVKDGTYCNYIKALYGIDSSGLESAFIGDNNCPNYEKITF